MNERRLFNRKDVLIIAAVLLLSVPLLIIRQVRTSENDDVWAKLNFQNQPPMIIDLSEDREFVIESLSNVRFKVQDGRIAFIASDCPDQICVRRGFLHRPGQRAACLPNRVSILIESGSRDENNIDIFIN